MAKSGSIRRVAEPDLAYINGDILRWALSRSSLSRDTIAKKLKVQPEQLHSWESGDSLPRFTAALDLARILAIPFGYLFLAEPPETGLAIPDFRRRRPEQRPSNEFQELLSDVLLKRDWYRDYARSEGEPKASFVGRFELSDPVADVAADIRTTLGMKLQLRAAAQSWSDYLSLLVRRAEQKGVLVMRTSVVAHNTQRPVSSTEVQGFALADEWAPVVFVNSSDFKAAQIFTFAHECAHLWIARTGISNPDEGESSPNAVERFCNRVATEILVPEDEFLAAWDRADPHSRITALSRFFWVSSLVILRRARELEKISDARYQALRADAVAAQTKPAGGGGSYFRTAAIRLGGRLSTAVLGEVDRGRLPLSQASELLGMRVATFLKFAESFK
jgi:Zn-dependent peptidase ImmA (M78 family)/DNA-binding XRE family transcriptional regulator